MATLPTASELQAAYPEFKAAPALLINQKVGEAASEIDPTTWGARYTRAVMLYAAHLLALTPEGEKMRRKDGTTVYQERWASLKRITALGRGRVAY